VGILNQLLALNASKPPPAVMLSAGYIFACAIPTLALIALSDISAERTSGLRLTIAAGRPVERESVIARAFKNRGARNAAGKLTCQICRAFSCKAMLCSNCGINIKLWIAFAIQPAERLMNFADPEFLNKRVAIKRYRQP